MKNEIVEPNDPRLTAYAVGEMTPEESAAFEVALGNSPAAMEEIERIRETAELLRAEFGAELHAAFTSWKPAAVPELTLVNDVRAHSAHQPPAFLPEMRTAIAALAAVLVAIAVVSVSWMKNRSGDQAGQSAVLADSLNDSNGERGREISPAASTGAMAEIAPAAGSNSEVIDSGTSWSVLASDEAALFPSYYLASAEANGSLAGTRRHLGDDPIQTEGRFLGQDGIEVQMMPVPLDPGAVIPAGSGAARVPAFRFASVPSPFGYTIRGLDPNVANAVGYLEIAGRVSGGSSGDFTRSLYLVGRSTDGNGNSSVRLKGQVHVEGEQGLRTLFGGMGDGRLELKKHETEAGNNGGGAAIGNGEVAEVANRYVTGLQERVNMAEVAALRGTQLLIDKDYEGSISEMRAAMDLLPDAPVTRERKQAYANQFATGSVNLAKQWADEGKYEEAQSLLEGVLAPSVDPGNSEAKELLKKLDNPEYYGAAAVPEHLRAVNAVELAQKRARGYIEIGDLENAERKYWSTLKEDLHNDAARSSLEPGEEGRTNYYELSRNQARAEFLEQVSENWEPRLAAGTQSGNGGAVPLTGDTVNLVGGAVINLSGGNAGRIAMNSGSAASSQTVLGPESSTRSRVVLPAPGSEGAPVDESLIDFMDQDRDAFGTVDTLGGKLDAGLSMNHAATGLVQPEMRWTEEEMPASSRTVPGRGKFAHIDDNPFKDPMTTALSTFSIDVDTASYSQVRRMILEDGQLPDRDQVRIEEFINFFNYDSYETPELGAVEENGQAPFSVSLECASAPWKPENRVVRIGLKGADFSAVKRPAANLVFLLDVSGSMSAEDKLPLMQKCLREFVPKLCEDDRITMVVYASEAGEVLEPTPGDDRETILEAINALSAKGSTNGEGGIKIAYQRARENFIEDGVNRVLLATDGDFNVGQDDDEELVSLIEQEAKSGVELTVLGFGTGNLNDSMLEKITSRGNGQFHYVDRLEEGRRVLVEGLNGSLVTIAKDVKIQVEFNAARVAGYRLIGYANRGLSREDFNDDTKDAGEIGAGHSVTALYEVVPVEAAMNLTQAEPVEDLKYKKRAGEEKAEAESIFERRQQAARKQQVELVESPELLTVKLKYKRPNAEESEPELQFPLVDTKQEFADASADFRFATAVGAFGDWLRFSSATVNWNPGGKARLTGNKLKVPITQGRSNRQLEKIARIADNAIEGDEFGRKKEFVEMIKAAATLNGGKITLESKETAPDGPAGEDVGESVKEKLKQLR